jgi:hypothetical protein
VIGQKMAGGIVIDEEIVRQPLNGPGASRGHRATRATLPPLAPQGNRTVGGVGRIMKTIF